MERDYNPINALHRKGTHNHLVCKHENVSQDITRYEYHRQNGDLTFVSPKDVLNSLTGTYPTAPIRVPVESMGEKVGKHWEENCNNLVVLAKQMDTCLYEPMTIKTLTGKSGLNYYFLSNQILTPEYVDKVADEYAEHNMFIEGLKPEVFKEDVYVYNPQTCIKFFYDNKVMSNASIALMLNDELMNMPTLYETYWDNGKITANPVGSLDYGELARVTVKEWRNGKAVDLNKFTFYTFVGDESSVWFNYNFYVTPSVALVAMRNLVDEFLTKNSDSTMLNSWSKFLNRLYTEYSEGVSNDIGVKIEVEDVNVYLPYPTDSPHSLLLPTLTK